MSFLDRRLSVPPLAGLVGRGRGSLGVGGVDGGVSCSLQLGSSSILGTHPRAGVPSLFPQGDVSAGGNLRVTGTGGCRACSASLSGLLQPRFRVCVGSCFRLRAFVGRPQAQVPGRLVDPVRVSGGPGTRYTVCTQYLSPSGHCFRSGLAHLLPSQVVQSLGLVLASRPFPTSPSPDRISMLLSTVSVVPPACSWLPLLGMLSSVSHSFRVLPALAFALLYLLRSWGLLSWWGFWLCFRVVSAASVRGSLLPVSPGALLSCLVSCRVSSVFLRP